jgi:hypothetical protein
MGQFLMRLSALTDECFAVDLLIGIEPIDYRLCPAMKARFILTRHPKEFTNDGDREWIGKTCNYIDLVLVLELINQAVDYLHKVGTHAVHEIGSVRRAKLTRGQTAQAIMFGWVKYQETGWKLLMLNLSLLSISSFSGERCDRLSTIAEV